MWNQIKRIKNRRDILLIAMGFAFFLGCADMGGYLKVPPVGTEDKITISDLEKTWQNYHVYYSGQSVANPMGVLFDPRNDEMTLVPEYWTKVEDEGTLRKAVSYLSDNRTQLPPGLRKIIGPDNRICGYVYSGVNQVFVKSTDAKTLTVYRIQDPARSLGGGR